MMKLGKGTGSVLLREVGCQLEARRALMAARPAERGHSLALNRMIHRKCTDVKFSGRIIRRGECKKL